MNNTTENSHKTCRNCGEKTDKDPCSFCGHKEKQIKLQVNSLSQSFTTYSGEEVKAMDGLDLTMYEGEFLTLVGPSGCGKSTFLRIVAGLDKPASGTIILDGKTCSRCGTVCPSNVTFCVNCESILKKVKDTMNFREDMISERPCPSCNSICPQNYNVCPHCNSILNPDFNTEVPVKTYEKRCAGCGAICNSSLPYCPSCEKPLKDMRETAFIEAVTAPVPVNKCPACGNICAANLKYCTECGKNL